MDIAKPHYQRSITSGGAVVLAAVACVGIAVGHPNVTMSASGALIVWFAAKFAATLTRRVVVEQDPNLELLWDLLLVVLIVLGLVGVGLMTVPYL